MTTAVERPKALFVTAGSRTCCVPLAHVIRGAPVPVVDLARAMGAPDTPATKPASRFVSLRVGGRTVALLVEAVVGVRELDVSPTDLPPLLGRAEMIESIGALDAQLLVVLRAMRVLSTDTWRAIDASTATA
jgi:chemotaxis signal transduction protein